MAVRPEAFVLLAVSGLEDKVVVISKVLEAVVMVVLDK
jgi:hypothetical protein